MQQELPSQNPIKLFLSENTIKLFECQIRDNIKAMFYSPFLRKRIQDYANYHGWNLERYYYNSYLNDLFFCIDLEDLHENWINEHVNELDQLSHRVAVAIFNKIDISNIKDVLMQDRFLYLYTQEGDLVIKVINGAYKSSEIRAISLQPSQNKLKQ